MATKKFLDSTGLQQVWDAVLDKDAAVLESAKSDTEAKLKDYLKSSDIAGAIAFERVDNYVPAGSPEGTEGIDAIVLKDANDNVIGAVPTADFVADGMLKSVTPNGDKLTFVFTTDEGEQNVEIDLSKYIDAYTAGDGISIDANNKIEVSNVGGEKVGINTIQCGGTWLGDQLKNNGISEISADNLQSVLESLFSVNTWPTIPTGEGKTWMDWPPRSIQSSVSISQPTPAIAFKQNNAAVSTVIVGSTVSVTVSAATATGSATVSYGKKVSNVEKAFPYGYSTSNDNIKDGNIPPSVTKYIVHSSGDYSLTVTPSDGFAGQAIGAISTSSTAASMTATNFVAAKGSNTITAVSGTPKFTITIPASDMPAYWACSTLGKTSNDFMIPAATEDKVYSNLQKTNVSKSSSVTGVYPIYTNVKVASNPSSSSTDNADGGANAKSSWAVAGESKNETKLTALTNDTVPFWMFLAFPAGGFTIKLPSGWKLEEVKTKSDTKDYVYDGGQSIIDNGTETITVAGTATDVYNVYSINADAGNVARLKISVKSAASA